MCMDFSHITLFKTIVLAFAATELAYVTRTTDIVTLKISSSHSNVPSRLDLLEIDVQTAGINSKMIFGLVKNPAEFVG